MLKRFAITITLLSFTFTAWVHGQIVHFPDPNLRDAVIEAIGVDPDRITRVALRRLERIDAVYKEIESLEGLQHTPNLRLLDLDGNRISDLTPLANLTNLVELGLDRNPVSDISPLAGLINLQVLTIDESRISDLTPLASLRNLEALVMDRNDITDISPLGRLTNLRILRINSNRISDLMPLANLANLEQLELDGNRIFDISPLAGLINLKVLKIEDNLIIDHSILDHLSIETLYYDQTCDMPRLPLTPRLENRTFPSIVAPFGRILNQPHLSDVERRSYHDLYFCCLMFDQRYFNTGRGWEVRGDHDNAIRLRDNFLAHNPNMIFIAEVRMQNEGGGYPPPDSPDWVWVQDSQGNAIYQGDRRLINFTHPKVQEMIVQQAIAVSKCGLYDGIFLDWWDEYGPTLGDSIENQIQQQARDDIIRRIRAATEPDFLILVNTNRRKTPRNGPYINGSFMETLVPSDAPADHVEALLAEVESSLLWLDTNLKEPRINSLEGWSVPSESLDSPTNLRWMRAFTTLSLTHSNGYVVFTKGRGHDHYWYDFWDADLGRPLTEQKGQLYEEREGLYIREYTNGWAVYNHSGAPQVITLPEEAQGVASGFVNMEHELSNLDGEMYLRVKLVNPADVNGDGIVNILDLILVAQGLGTNETEVDVNGDGVVNVFDLVFVANQF